MTSLLRGPSPRGPASMAQHRQFHESMVRDIIQEEIIEEQNYEIAALASLLLQRHKQEDASSNSYETSYEYYEEDEEEEDDDELWNDPSSLQQPQPTGRKRALPRNETQPLAPQKRQRIDPKPAAQPQPRPQEGQEPSTPTDAKGWEPPLHIDADHSHRHPVLQAVLEGSAIEYCRPVAQAFLEDLNCDELGALDVAEAVYDMGIRFSRMASDHEFNIVFCLFSANPRDAVMYNISQRKERHAIFWGKVQRITHRAIPPDPLEKPDKKESVKVEPERKVKEVKPKPEPKPVAAPVTTRPVARPVLSPVSRAQASVKKRGNLKASLIKEVDEKTKMPLNERVRKWLDEIIPMETKAE